MDLGFVVVDLDGKAERGGEVEEARERGREQRTQIEGKEEEFEIAEPGEEEGGGTAEMEGAEIERKEEEDEENGEESKEPWDSLGDLGSEIVGVRNERNGNCPYLG